ncbi:MAG: hypothetical protein LBV12_13145 [Puniceicoccales bacterium]|jgi:hypothetical protein|nr:hypothetical protein [Puniceicoccales bacterium]
MDSKEPERKLTPEEEAKVARAQYILWGVMVIFIVLPFIIAWLTGAFSKR